MDCPYCKKPFKPNNNIQCDNDCETMYCSKCGNDVVEINGRLFARHDRNCGDESDESSS